MPEPKKSLQSYDVDSRIVAWTGGGIFAAVILALLVAWLAWHAWIPAQPGNAAVQPQDSAFAGPRLESTPQADLKRYEAEKEAVLHSLRWIDRRNGVAGIPIEEAMKIMAAQGIEGAPIKQGEKR